MTSGLTGSKKLAVYSWTGSLTGTLDKGVLDGVVWPKDVAGMTVEAEIIKSVSDIVKTQVNWH